MTNEEIARLRALCEKATPGPWKQSWMWVDKHSMPMCVEQDDGSGDGPAVCRVDEYDERGPADAEFIAAARTALPAALDEIERMRGVLERISVGHHSGTPENDALAGLEDAGRK